MLGGMPLKGSAEPGVDGGGPAGVPGDPAIGIALAAELSSSSGVRTPRGRLLGGGVLVNALDADLDLLLKADAGVFGSV